jgi:sodium-dependent dicarboxylate transporter 2/3/5
VRFKVKRTVGILIFILLSFLILSQSWDLNVKKGLLVLSFAGVFWIFEVLPLSVTALSVPVLGVLLGIDSVKGALSSFAHPIIFLFLGGFALATALQKYSLDRLIAYKIVSLARGSVFASSIFLFGVVAFISMWISNTSTTAMALPLALGILGASKSDWRLKHFILLGVAYSASVGGIGTLVGSPPNGITAAELGMGFTDWLRFGLPTVLVLFPILIVTLLLVFRPNFSGSFTLESFELKLGKKEVLVLFVFLTTVILWLFGKPISHLIGVKKYFDAVVAIFAVILLFVFNLLNWKELEEKLRVLPEREAIEFLKSYPFIGSKTARVILTFGFGKNTFPIDTHCRRVLNRLGIFPKDWSLDEISEFMEENFSAEFNRKFHYDLIRVGRKFCKPKKPKCEECPLRRVCSYQTQTLSSKTLF